MPLTGGSPALHHQLAEPVWSSLTVWPWAGPWPAGHLASLAQSHPPNGCGQWARWTAGAQDGRASS